jgi:hypothetical protein
MTEELPDFPYHPDPVATGALNVSDKACGCCGRWRGYIYMGSVYSSCGEGVEICPWCISDGSAAKKFKAIFNDVCWMISQGVPRRLANIVRKKTPSYSSWQEVIWLHHCDDACEFHGEASVEDVRSASADTIDLFIGDDEEFKEHFRLELQEFTGEGEIVLYKYICRHCRLMLLGYEYS